MRVLIVEDDFTSRKLLQKFLASYGECDVAVDGEAAIEAYKMSWVKSRPYDLICMDIMMPKMDGDEALMKIREIEKEMDIKGRDEVKVIMTTVLDDPKNVFKSFSQGGASSYIVKPISKQTLIHEVQKLGLME